MTAAGKVREARFPAWLLAATAVIAFFAVTAWLAHGTWQHLSASRLDRGLLTDFRDAVYYPARALLDGVNPYDVDSYYRSFPVGQEFPLYTPIHLLVHSPLVLVSLGTARRVYFGINVLLMLGLAWSTLRLAGHRATVARVFGLGTLLLLSDPGKFELRTGQPTLLIVLGVYLALASGRDHPWSGALGLVLAFIKPTFGIPLVVLMLCRRQTRAAIAGSVAAGALSVLGAIPLVDAAGGVGRFVDSLTTDLDVTSRATQSRLGTPIRIDAANTLARLTGLRPAETVATVFGVGLLALGAWVAWRLHRAAPSGDRGTLPVTLACLTLLLAVYHVPYDLLLLTWPIVLLARHHPADAAAWPRYGRGTVLALLLVPTVDPMGWSVVNDVVGRKGLMSHLAGATTNGLCLIVAFGLCTWVAVRATRRTRDRDRTPASGVASWRGMAADRPGES